MAILPGMQINLTQSQQLKMTPQLQQSIKILQQSSLEIQQMLNEALEENLFLEPCVDTHIMGVVYLSPDNTHAMCVSDPPGGLISRHLSYGGSDQTNCGGSYEQSEQIL